MLDHVLVHLRGRGSSGPGPGGYVPPGFRPPRRAGVLAAAHAALWGAEPDPAMLEYRSWQLAQVLAGSDFAADVTASDSRLSYDVARPPSLESFAPRLRVEGLFGASPAAVYLAGTMPEEAGSGALDWTWQLHRADDVLSVARLAPRPVPPVDTALAFTAGLSAPVALPGSRLTVRLEELTDVEPAGWTVAARLRPTAGVVELIAGLVRLGAELEQTVFTGADERSAAWRSTWDSQRPIPERLAAFLLAYAQTLERRAAAEAGHGR